MNRRSGLTLIELLATLMIVAVVIAAGGRLFRDGWVMLHRSVRVADEHQALTLLMRRWQETLGPTVSETWQATGDAFRAGEVSVTREGTRLVFRRAERIQATHAIGDRPCTFSMESVPGAGALAVLTISMPDAHTARVRHHAVRIVARGGQP